jgi:DNA-binding NtrC family response regulator
MTNIILVCKDPELKAFVRKALEDTPVRIAKECATSKEAAEAYAEGSVNFLIVDMFLSGSSGFDVMKTMRKMDETVQFILITRMRTRSSIDRAFRLGAADVLVYPCQVETLKQTVLHRLEQVGVEPVVVSDN